MQKLLDRNLLTSLVLFAIGGVFLTDSGSDLKDWIFPLLASYTVLAIGAALFLGFVFRMVTGQVPNALHMAAEDRIAGVDVFVFLVIALGYLFLISGLGFWLASLFMVMLSSIYLTLEKTRHNMMLAIVVPIVACVVAYVIFLHVFYVPFPKATWWIGIE